MDLHKEEILVLPARVSMNSAAREIFLKVRYQTVFESVFVRNVTAI
jgi:hypothetical protein